MEELVQVLEDNDPQDIIDQKLEVNQEYAL